MNITTAFVIRLVKFPAMTRNAFLWQQKHEIDFTLLTLKLKDMINDSVERGESSMAEKLSDIKADIALYEAVGRFPAAVTEFILEQNPNPAKKVSLELIACSEQ